MTIPAPFVRWFSDQGDRSHPEALPWHHLLDPKGMVQRWWCRQIAVLNDVESLMLWPHYGMTSWNVMCESPRSAAHLVSRVIQWKRIDLLNLCLEYGVPTDGRYARPTSPGSTVLHEAASHYGGWVEGVQRLLDHPLCDANALNKQRATPLMVASEAKAWAVVIALTKNPGIDVHAMNRRGHQALGLALRGCLTSVSPAGLEACWSLIQHGASITKPQGTTRHAMSPEQWAQQNIPQAWAVLEARSLCGHLDIAPQRLGERPRL